MPDLPSALADIALVALCLSLDGADLAADPTLDHIIEQAQAAGVALSEEVRAQIADLAQRHLSPAALLDEVATLLEASEPLLARTVAEAMVAAWLTAGREVARKLPAQVLARNPTLPPWKPPPPPPSAFSAADEPAPLIRFPLIEAAAADLEDRRLVTRPEFDRLTAEARQQAFAVARVASLDTLGRVRDLLVEDVAAGGTLRQFRERVGEVLGEEGALSPGHVENVYRTNVMTAYTAGMDAVLAHPLVDDEFPFIETVPILDSRLTDLCRIVSRSGLDGTGIYLRTDPEWALFKPPRHWNCRCGMIPLSVADAAARGVKYAQRWLAEGRQPQPPEYVPRVPAELPKGWRAA